MDGEDARAATLAWLKQSEPPAPLELERRVRRAVERLSRPGATIAETMVAAAFECLRDAASTGSQRSAASELLAADALLTYAFEVAAEEGVAGLDRLARALDSRRFEDQARTVAS